MSRKTFSISRIARNQILDLVANHGEEEAARMLQTSLGTIRNWQKFGARTLDKNLADRVAAVASSEVKVSDPTNGSLVDQIAAAVQPADLTRVEAKLDRILQRLGA